MTVEEARQFLGRRVIYTPTSGPRERGVLTSVGHQYVFVRYDADDYSKATPPELLALETS